MAEHTPTPWEANKQWLYASDGRGNTTRTVPVASAQAEWVTADGGPLRDEAIANAALIVRAVNSHQALVDALSLCMDTLTIMGRVYSADDSPALNLTMEKARAALASAQSVEVG